MIDESRARRAEPEVARGARERPPGWTREGLRRDIAGVHRHFAGSAELKEWKRPRPGSILAGVALSWLVILAAWAAVVWLSALLLPVALLVIGSRQRALGNALHDSAHGNGVRSRRLNRWIIAAPMFEDFESYRRAHLAHHAYLGDAAMDPDYLEPPPPESRAWLAPWRLYRHYLFRGRMWRASLLGELVDIGGAARLRVALCWAVISAVLVLVAELDGLWFVALWMGARATVYHLIKVFTELADHVGLVPGSIYSFTRNSPHNWLSAILHPHADNYHLAHHLMPRVPTHRLGELHRELLQIHAYRLGHHCHRHFFGPGSVARSWLHSIPR